MTTFEALGFDPAPGDSYLTSSAAGTVRTVTAALDEVVGVLAGEDDGRWQGQAAEVFRTSMREELTPRIRDASDSFAVAARALTSWADALPGFQDRAAALEREAQDARAQLHVAQAGLRDLVQDDSTDPEDRRAGEARVDATAGALATVIARAEGLRSEVEQLASTTARSLDTAAANAPDKPGFWASVGNWIVDTVESFNDWFWESFVPLFEELAPWIGLALAIASMWIPVLGQIGMALAIAAIAINTGQAIRGEGSWGDVALGVAGLAGGMALGKVLSGFESIRNSAFKIGVQFPRPAPVGMPAPPIALTAVIRFDPTMYNIGTFGWAGTKVYQLYRSMPEPVKPSWPTLELSR